MPANLAASSKNSLPASAPIVAVDRESVDLADPEQTRELVRRAAPDLILNAAAYTAVDRAESERDLAYAINEGAPRVLAEEALRARRAFRPLLD